MDYPKLKLVCNFVMLLKTIIFIICNTFVSYLKHLCIFYQDYGRATDIIPEVYLRYYLEWHGVIIYQRIKKLNILEYNDETINFIVSMIHLYDGSNYMIDSFLLQKNSYDDDLRLFNRAAKLFSPKVMDRVGNEEFKLFIENAFIPCIKKVSIIEITEYIILSTNLYEKSIFEHTFDYIVDYRMIKKVS